MYRCYLKLGEWEENINGIDERSIPQILQYYSQAIEKDKSWYKVKHNLLLTFYAVNSLNSIWSKVLIASFHLFKMFCGLLSTKYKKVVFRNVFVCVESSDHHASKTTTTTNANKQKKSYSSHILQCIYILFSTR